MNKRKIVHNFSMVAFYGSKIISYPGGYRNFYETDWNKTLKEDKRWNYDFMKIKNHWKNKKNQKIVDKFLNKTIELTCINKYEKLENHIGVLHKDEEGLYCVSDVFGSTWFELFQVKDIKLIERD